LFQRRGCKTSPHACLQHAGFVLAGCCVGTEILKVLYLKQPFWPNFNLLLLIPTGQFIYHHCLDRPPVDFICYSRQWRKWNASSRVLCIWKYIWSSWVHRVVCILRIFKKIAGKMSCWNFFINCAITIVNFEK